MSPLVQIKPLALRSVKVSEDETVQELGRPHRSNSKEQLSEVSPRKGPFNPLFADPLQRARALNFHRPSRVEGGGGDP